MLFQTVFTSLALSSLVAGHAMFQDLWVDGKDQARSCVRMPKSNSPVENVLSPDMRCNAGGSVGIAGLCEVPAGANLTVEMHQHDERKCTEEAIGGRHFGPVMIYICSVADAKTATGDCSWVKIAEDTYSGTDASWGTEKLNWGCGKKAFIIPPSLKAGNYLIRAEAIALHSAQRKDGAQFYMSCYQVNVSGKGTEVLPKGVTFPGAYKNTDPGILVDIYQSQGSYGKHIYVAPGPEVWTPGAVSSPTVPAKGVPEEAAPPVEAVPETKPQSARPTEAVSTPKPSVPETKPDVTVPEPEVTVPEPQQVATPQPTPEITAPEPTPEVTAPETVPEVAIPAPVQPAPVQPAPVQPAPVQPAPVQPAPVQPAPVQPAPVQPMPEVTAPEPVPEVAVPAPVQPKPIQPAPKPHQGQPKPHQGQPKLKDDKPHQGQPKPKDDKPPCLFTWFCPGSNGLPRNSRTRDHPKPVKGWPWWK